MGERAHVNVQDNTERHRFEAVDESGAVAGFVNYRRHDDRIELVHTEVDPDFEGRGVGSALARSSLDAIRSAGMPAQLTCSFIAGYVDKHPEYADLTT
ncbi:MAG TPA: GNAT family N-acetyltransferase [Nocardioidaceae bacterium]|nr:GNAT family N-acetyltransferase [Nocardioidaceae bacterium]